MIRIVAIASLAATLILALWLPSAFPAARFLAQLRADHSAASDLWGPQVAAEMLDRTTRTIEATPRLLPGPASADVPGHPLDTAVSREMTTVGQRLFDNAYFRSIEALMLLALFRAGAIGHALPWLLPFVLATMVDGQLSRLRKSREFRRHDPEVFALAVTGAIFVACASFVALLLPIDIPALAWPAAPLVAGWLLAVALASFHHRP